MKLISKLALMSSLIIIISVIYSFIFNVSLFHLKIIGYRYIILISVISIVFHLISVYKDRDKTFVVIFSSAIPIVVLISFIVGFIRWIFGGV